MIQKHHAEILTEALKYSDRGYKWIPMHGIENYQCTCGNKDCDKAGKHPRVKWSEENLRDSESLKASLEQWPTSNLAILTGNGFIVMDVDKKSGGLESLDKLEKEHGPLPDTPTVLTGGGGRHYYFKCEKKVRSSTCCFKGIDIRGDGGIIITPNSTHKSGIKYRWEDKKSIFEIPLAEIPNWLLKALLPEEDSHKSKKELKVSEFLVEGNRNDTLFKIGCYLRAKGIDGSALFQTITSVNRFVCKPPLLDEEMNSILKNVFSYDKKTIGDEYCIQDGCISKQGINKKGELEIVSLCNFESVITLEEILDNGVEQHRQLILNSRLNDGLALPTLELSSSEFSSLSWVLTKLGADAIVYPGMTTKEHLRAAIQFLSRGHKIIEKYTHLGWRKIDGEYYFLSTSGAVHKDGFTSKFKTSADIGRLFDYNLPAPAEKTSLIPIVLASLDFLKLTKETAVATGLYASIFRAPLNEILPIDYSPNIIGDTGTFKSEICGVALAHFGRAFRGKNLSENWTSTPNSIELRSFLTKDCLFVIDDFVPGVVPPYVAERIFRGQGNKNGRGRMYADGSLRTTYYSRCLPVSTGEDITGCASLRARMMILDVTKGDIDKDQLTTLQTHAANGVLAQAMSSYIQWLAPRMDILRGLLPKRLVELRDLATTSHCHKRTPDMIASAAIGIEIFLEFAVDNNVLSEGDREQLWNKAWSDLGKISELQNQYQEHENPAKRFVDLIRTAFSSARAHLVDLEKEKKNQDPIPKDHTSWGWKNDGYSTGPKGEKIGWVREDSIFLDPECAFIVAQKIARDQGRPFYTNKETLWKRLAEQKFIAPSSSEGKNTVKVSIGNGERPRLLQFPNKEILRPTQASDFADQQPNLWQSAPQAPEAPDFVLERIADWKNLEIKKGDLH